MFVGLTYVSRPVVDLDDAALMELWISSIERNEDAGITGALYVGNEHFFHTVEGVEEEVIPLFDCIRSDKRHGDVTLIAENDLTIPMFREYPLKLIDGRRYAPSQQLPGFEEMVEARRRDIDRATFRMARL
jgi:hypothetical protein